MVKELGVQVVLEHAPLTYKITSARGVRGDSNVSGTLSASMLIQRQLRKTKQQVASAINGISKSE
jgi:hypothetical protein